MKTNTSIQQIVLQINQFMQNYTISMHTLTGARIVKPELILLPWLDSFEARIIAYFGEHVVMDRKLSFPTTWWDAVKERFMPEWLKRRFPVNFTSVEVKVAELATRWAVPSNLGPWPYMTWNERTYYDQECKKEK